MNFLNALILTCLCMNLSLHSHSQNEQTIRYKDLDEAKAQDMLDKIMRCPPIKLTLEEFSHEDFMYLYQECLSYMYPATNVFTHTPNCYTLYLSDSLEFEQIRSNCLNQVDVLNLYCKSSSAGVSASADTNGNKKIEIDVSSRSDDGKVNVRACAG